MAIRDPIEHVVLLMLSRRSFDQMLGCFKEVYPDLQGVDPNNLRVNYDPFRTPFAQAPTAARRMRHAPVQELEDVAVQLGRMNTGFVLNFSEKHREAGPPDRQAVMAYYPLGSLPALHALAKDFTICERWFASVPGPTWPNRAFALSGTALGQARMPESVDDPDLGDFFKQRQETIFDRLSESGKSWAVYFHDIPQSWTLEHQRRPENAARYQPFSEYAAAASGPERGFPAFVLIEPCYTGPGENDGHPLVDVMRSEQLLAEVYNPLRANAALWQKSLLVVLFDSHGGFYDHDAPPRSAPPDRHVHAWAFDSLGPRVPALLASPWVKRGVVSSVFDHTSLLKYLIEKWNLGHLRRRTAAASSLAGALASSGEPRADTVASLSLSAEQLRFEGGDEDAVPVHWWAFAALAKQLSSELAAPPPEEHPAAKDVPAYVRARTALFLASQKEKASRASGLGDSLRKIGSLLRLR